MASSLPPDAVAVRINAMKDASMIWASEAPSAHMSENARKLYEIERRLSAKLRSKREEFRTCRDEGQFVAVKSVADDNKWHRGKIHESFSTMQGIRYQVDLIDYGTRLRAKPAHIYDIPKEFIDCLPPQAMLLHLYGILPLSHTVDWLADSCPQVINLEWTPAAEKFVNDSYKSCRKAYFVERKPTIHGRFEVNMKFGDLLLCLSEDEEQLESLSELLCSKKLATRDEIVFLRRLQNLYNVPIDRPEVCGTVNSVQSKTNTRCDSSVNNRSHENKVFIDSSQKIPNQKPPTLMADYIAEREAKKEELKPSNSNSKAHDAPKDIAKEIVHSSMSEDNCGMKGDNTVSDSSVSESSKAPNQNKDNPLVAVFNLLKKRPAVAVLPVSANDNRATSSQSDSEKPALKTGIQEYPTNPSSKNSQLLPPRRKHVLEDSKITFLPAGRNVSLDIETNKQVKQNLDLSVNKSRAYSHENERKDKSREWDNESRTSSSSSFKDESDFKALRKDVIGGLTPVASSSKPTTEPKVRHEQKNTNITFIPAGRSVVNDNKMNTQPRKVRESVSDSDSNNSVKSSFRQEKTSKMNTQSSKVRENVSDSDTNNSVKSNFRQEKISDGLGWTDDSGASSSDAGYRNSRAAVSPNSHSQDHQQAASPPHSGVDQGNNTANPNMLRCKMSSIRSEEIRCEEEYLTRRVLLHGGLPPRPWMCQNDILSSFSNHILQYLQLKKWLHNILTLEKYIWPATLKRQNIVMVSGPKSGKTLSYLIPLMDFICDAEMSKGNGPLVLILCSGCKAAQDVYSRCVKTLSGCKSKARVYLASGLVLDEDFMIKLVNGCEVLITTPFCFLRLVGYEGIIVNMRRLCHLVLDEADVLFGKFFDQMKDIVVHEQRRRTEDGDPIQIIVASEKWMPIMADFTAHLRSNPLVCINDPLEAVVYGKAKGKLHSVHSSRKPSELLNLLNKHFQLGLMKIIVICSSTHEVDLLEKFFKNACFAFLVIRPDDSLTDREACLHSWNSSCDGKHYILLCVGSDIANERIQDAMCLIFYSLPAEDKSVFVHCLSTVMDNLKNMFESEKAYTPPQIHIYVDETQTEQLPVVVQLLHRLAEHVEESVENLAKSASKRKEESKTNKPLCCNIKMFGDCWDKSSCPDRHTLVPELDSPKNLPNCGEVTLKILAVHNACHYSVRIMDYTSKDGVVHKWSDEFMHTGLKMSFHFSSEKNKQLQPDVDIGCICAVETAENLFKRVVILEIQERDKRKKPTVVKVQFIDEGLIESNKKTYELYYLPQHLRDLPAQATDVFVCRLVPCDNDESWNDIATNCVRQWVKTTDQDEANSKVFKGQVIFSLRNALWIEPLYIMKLLPHTKTYVCVLDVRRRLIEGHHAIENRGHLKKLHALSAGHDCFTIPTPKEKRCLPKPKVQPKPAWAFLDTEGFNAVEFSSADGANCFFLRRRKFSLLLKKLLEDIGHDLEQSKNKEIPVLESGLLCLARYSEEGTWHRAKILSVDNDVVQVFYVDYGDRETIGRQEIIAIPDWAISKLPFQAIECSMAGVSSVDPVDKLYDVTDDGSKALQAKVCEKIKFAECTGGHRYIVTILDCSSSSPSVLNKDLLAFDGVKPCEEQLKYIDVDLQNCQATFELSSNEESEDESDVLPPYTSEELLTSLKELKNSGTSSSSTNQVLPESDDLIVWTINGYNFNPADMDLEAAQDFMQSVKPKQLTEIPRKHQQAICEFPDNESEKIQSRNIKNSKNSSEMSNKDNHKDRIHRITLPLLSSARPPSIKWSEDLYHVWLKILISGAAQYFLRWSASRLQFSSSVAGKNYHFDQELRGTILPQDLIIKPPGLCIEIKLRKACSGVYWRRPFVCKLKFVTADYECGRCSDESSDEFEPTIEAINRGIKKLPLKQRRRRHSMKDGPAIIDDSGDDSGSSVAGDCIDENMLF